MDSSVAETSSMGNANSVTAVSARVAGLGRQRFVETLGCAEVDGSVIEIGGVRHFGAVVTARGGRSLADEVLGSLAAIEAWLARQEAYGCLAHLTVFVRDTEAIATCRRMFEGYFGPDLPAASYVVQPPCSGAWMSAEITGVADGRSAARIRRMGSNLVCTEFDGMTLAYAADTATAQASQGAFEQTSRLLQRLAQALQQSGCAFDRVLRTWFYLGDIVGEESGTQRYKELNRARTEFYRDKTFGCHRTPAAWHGPVYPASTGIGACGRDLVGTCVALVDATKDTVIAPLENPQQTAACDYDLRFGPHSPKFSRALAVATPAYSMTFISGTASITAAETRHLCNAELQTQQTLDNIEALISPANFARQGLSGCGANLSDLATVRVYVKRAADFPAIRAICQERLRGVPAVFVVSDVCRPELLVEIEGVALAANTSPAG